MSTARDHKEKHQIQLEQHRIYNEKHQLYTEALRCLQKLQLNKPTSTIDPVSVYEQTFFHYARRVMPERDMLARILPMKVSLCSSDGRTAI